jgi:hypothetical protein
MRRVCARPRGRLGGLALLLLGGCCLPGRPAGLVERFKPFIGPQGADAVALDVALVELPVGDRYLNAGLWEAADEQVVPLERKAVLEDNGFRIGVVGGIPPSAFQTLLASERTCPEPRRIQMRAGNARPLPLGEPRSQCCFELHQDGKVTPVALEQGQYVLQVTPALTPEGSVKLAFLPLVQHGAKALWALPGEGGLPLQGQRPAETYPALGWEMTLAAGEYAVIGTRFEKAGTLGHVCFLNADGARPVQRLLAIRATRLTAPGAVPDSADAAGRPPAVPPLAYQAAVTKVRGCGE